MTHSRPIRTSDTHPIRIDAVLPAEGWGKIGMSFCPGKQQVDGLSGHWARDLHADLIRVRDWGAAMFVSLVEEHEFAELQVQTLPQAVASTGMVWRHLPIRDRYPPSAKFEERWGQVGEEIVHTLKAGRNVFIHCKGGLGRTGTVAACLLIEAGYVAEAAINEVRRARARTIETAVQEWYVLQYRARFGDG